MQELLKTQFEHLLTIKESDQREYVARAVAFVSTIMPPKKAIHFDTNYLLFYTRPDDIASFICDYLERN